MCFSANFSFGAALLLGTLGYFTLKKARHAQEIPLYSIPLLFAIQQATEGFLWLSVINSYTGLNHVCAYLFLVFAFVIWPSWMPYSLFSIETNKQRKQWLALLLTIGLCFSGYFIYRLYALPFLVTVDTNINYTLFIQETHQISLNIWYGLCTVFPFFISSVPLAWVLGILLLISYFFTYHFYYCCLVSVWCFFVALISGLLFMIAHRKHTQL